MSNALGNVFASALDFFFRRRPPIDALLWHPENLAAGDTFTIPDDKIYECYVYTAGGLVQLDGKNLTSVAYPSIWLPAFLAGLVTTSSITGEIGTPGSGDTLLIPTQAATKVFITASDGWRFTSKQVISVTAGAWTLMWRDITDV